MAKNNSITFYDLALASGATISPFVWATKYAVAHKGLELDVVPGGFTGIFAVRQGDVVRVWVNSCPHVGTPLDWTPDRFMSRDGQHIICATHGALFSTETGDCTLGPCRGGIS